MNTERKKNLEAVLAVSTGLILLYFIFKQEAFVIAAFVLSVISLLSGYFTDKFGWLWWKFAKGLGYVMGNVMLTIVFFVFLTPIALINKLFVGDPLMLKKKERKSTYVERNIGFTGKDIENVW
ncbi:MAG: hypothetical protein PHT69_11050 [Bacteroidales bacterium]|nr:hypothetical protein [Bacteroidales bacterium]